MSFSMYLPFERLGEVISGSVRPFNSHLCIENSDHTTIYFVDSANQKLLKKLVVATNTVTTVETRTRNIQSAWHDWANDKIYFVCCDNVWREGTDTQWTCFYIDLSDDSITEMGTYVKIAPDWVNAYDIFKWGSDFFVLAEESAAGQTLIYKWVDPNWVPRDGNSVGMCSFVITDVTIPAGNRILYTIGDSAVLGRIDLMDYEDVTPQVSILNFVDGTLLEIPSRNQQGISYDGSDVLYFILGTGTPENSTIVADIANNINTGEYINYSSIDKNGNHESIEKEWYIWFNKDAGGGDPAPAGRTAIEVTIAGGQTAQQVSNAIRDAINNVSTNSGNIAATNAAGTSTTVTILNQYNGNPTNIADVDSGLVVATTTPGVDNTYNLYTYSISGDVITQIGEYDISLMLDRNTLSTHDIPFNLEKAFDIAKDASNQSKIYQISKGRGNIFAKAEIERNANIIAITDNYIIFDDFYLYQWEDCIEACTSKSYIHARTRNYWKATLFVNTQYFPPSYTHLTKGTEYIRIFDGMFLQIIGYMTYSGNGWYHNEPDNFNDETAGAITVAGDMDWIDTLTLPDTCTATLGTIDDHKNVLGISHAGVGDPIIIHSFPTQETSGIYEWYWGSSDVVRNQTIRFRGTGIAIYLRINTSKYTYLDSLDAEIEIIGATPTNNILDHFKLVWDCATDTFDLYINKIKRVTAGEFNNPDTYIDELYMASITGAVYTQYIDAPGNVADANYYEGMNLLETDRNAVVMEGYVVWDDDEHKRKISLHSPAMFDLKNKTEVGEYSGRTDQHIASNLVDWANYIIAGTMANGNNLGTLIQLGRKSLKVRINGHAQHDQFIWVLIPDGGQGLLNYNAGNIDSGESFTQADGLGKFKKKKLRKIINQVNLKGAINPTTGAPYKWTEDDLASQQIYGVQPIFRTFANLDTEPLLETQAQSILTMDQSTPYKYTFTKAIGSEGLVLPSERINLTYTPKSVIADDRIIDNIKFYFRKKRALWTVVDAITYTSDMDILRQEIQENTDYIEQSAQTIHNLVGGFVLYFNDDASGDIGGYKQLTTGVAEDAVATSVTAITAADQEIEQWATESGVPGLNLLQSGITQFHYHAWKSAGTKDIRIYFKFYKRTDPGGVETLLYTTEESGILPGASAGGEIHALAIETDLDDTDRIVVKLFASPYSGGSNPTLSFSIEGTTATRVEFPAPISGAAGGGELAIIGPDKVLGAAGFVDSGYFGASLTVLFSDVNANVNYSLYVKDGGTFQVLITHNGQGNNNGKTASGMLYASYDVADGVSAWDINGVNCDLPLGDIGVNKFYTHVGNDIVVADDTRVALSWVKDDNAGAAALFMHIYGMYLVRQ